ncbi:unnamed protein product, partial [Darwinula stevensoni]
MKVGEVFESLRKFDAYPKTLEDFRIKTFGGGAVTLVSSILMVLLFMAELNDYLKVEIKEDLFVDLSRGQKLRINFDMVFPRIACGFISLDSMDNSGERQTDITHNIYKIKLDMDGKPIANPEREEVISLDSMDNSGERQTDITHNIYKIKLDMDGKPIANPEREEAMASTSKSESTNCFLILWIVINGNFNFVYDVVVGHPGADGVDYHLPSPLLRPLIIIQSVWDPGTIVGQNTTAVATKNEPKCGSCYGAETKTRPCCNSCREVSDAYREKGWAIRSMDEIEQCKDESSRKEIEWAVKEGCHIYGYLDVNRVGGNFHFAPGKTYSGEHVHVHDLQTMSLESVNLTHTIQHLSFGRHIRTHNDPLDSTVVISEKGAMMYQYHLKIVPTKYERADGSTLDTNQFSVTRHEKSLMSMMDSGIPGVFFHYDFSPLMVKYTEKTKSLGHFATGLCAIIGGVFTVAGLIDALLYHGLKKIQRKMELGKFWKNLELSVTSWTQECVMNSKHYSVSASFNKFQTPYHDVDQFLHITEYSENHELTMPKTCELSVFERREKCYN